MTNFREDFPIFKNNPDLIYFDSTATSQKPSLVINGINKYLETTYSSIHRGLYNISEKSEKLYNDSKKKVAKFVGAYSYKEIIYTYNSTYALNLLSSSIGLSKQLKKGDKILLTEVEHNTNIIPWLILKESIGIEIEYIKIDKDFNLDLNDFKNKYDEKVKIISFTHVSNVTGQIFDLEEIGKSKRDDTIFIVDVSQSIPHIDIDVKKLNCDYLFFTGHKVFADTGIGVLWGKEKLLKELKPSFSGGGAIGTLVDNCFTYAKIPDKFEAGTQNVSGAVSLLKAFEYIEYIGGYSVLEKYENELVEYFLDKFKKYKNIKLIGSNNYKNRLGVFSMVIEGFHSNDVADILADNNIAVRSGKHCAHSYFNSIGLTHSFRVSLYIYNTKEEIDKFFNILNKIINAK
ncbi:aminotransferase class V-fold PLP-dependent enzyme [Candidatus Gracilibacteria bacterium]|nr:aminotransferase class V-fold PLP-dependent enzyme [Candidatus Gracilibacteria bacterium]